jgi:Tat protein secretion system quality control protein TatD with DNase activity
VAEVIAELRGTTAAAIGQATGENFAALFNP